MYDQKKEKQPDLDTIKGMIGELLANPEACDKNNIRDVQSDVCSKWHDFTELLIDLIVMQVRRDNKHYPIMHHFTYFRCNYASKDFEFLEICKWLEA